MPADPSADRRPVDAPPAADTSPAVDASADARPADASVVVNGEAREAAGSTVVGLVGALGLPEDGRGVAVAIGGEVVPRGAWAARVLRAGEHVEVLTAMQGG